MNAKQNKKQGAEKMMEKKDQIRVQEIIINLITRNMAKGLDYEAAKTAAFNRLNRDYQGVLKVFLASK